VTNDQPNMEKVYLLLEASHRASSGLDACFETRRVQYPLAATSGRKKIHHVAIIVGCPSNRCYAELAHTRGRHIRIRRRNAAEW